MSAKSQRLRRRLEVSEARRARLSKLLNVTDDQEAIDKLSFRLAQATLHAWNNNQAFGNDYFKSADGKRIVKKVSEVFTSLLSK